MDSPDSEQGSSEYSFDPLQNSQVPLVDTYDFGDPDDSGQTSSQTLSSDTSDAQEHCSHLNELLSDAGNRSTYTKKYKLLVTWAAKTHGFNRSSSSNIRPAKRRKVLIPECDFCQLPLHRPFVCLLCNYSGCWKGQHIIDHLEQHGHGFCIDVNSGSIYCIGCDDFIYNSAFEKVRAVTELQVEERGAKFQESKSKNIRKPFEPWAPTSTETHLLEKSNAILCQGRRGLINLGATCYLNAILQTFIHNPLLRNHFLSDKHPHDLCDKQSCLCCEMDKLFSEVYSGSTTPYGPASFLATMWKAATELSGYQQQDAHEFFIAALNQIHTTSKGSTSILCKCVVHSTFAGQLQSEVQCGKCGNITSVVDPMLEITLEIKGQAAKSDNTTLIGCLRRFTQSEKLDPKGYTCTKCPGGSQDATRRLSIRKLPPVLCFTFKRFEHNSSASKIDTHVRFPATLNMSPYTSLAAGIKGNKDTGLLGPSAMYDYELFAVVNHEGQVNTGHYTNFARFQDDWYRFDDEKVTPATLRECLDSRAYMCVYVKRHLDYKPHQTPTYIVAQQQAAKEKEKESAMKEKETATMKELADLAAI